MRSRLLAPLLVVAAATPALASADVQPVTKHATDAPLRFAPGLDKTPVGLAPRSAKQFGDVNVAYSASTGRG